jgi:hypothetical protein
MPQQFLMYLAFFSITITKRDEIVIDKQEADEQPRKLEEEEGFNGSHTILRGSPPYVCVHTR